MGPRPILYRGDGTLEQQTVYIRGKCSADHSGIMCPGNMLELRQAWLEDQRSGNSKKEKGEEHQGEQHQGEQHQDLNVMVTVTTRRPTSPEEEKEN